jgi:hypothetical protein
MNKQFKHSQRRKRHELKRRRIIENRLKTFNSKSIPSIFKKVKPIEKVEVKKVGFWQRIKNWIKHLWK